MPALSPSDSLHVLADAGKILSGEPDLRSALERVIRLTVPVLADGTRIRLAAPEGGDGLFVEAPPETGHLREILAVPLQSREGVLGTLALLAAEPGRTYDGADRVLVEDLAGRIALAAENDRLRAECRRQAESLREADRAIEESLRAGEKRLGLALDAGRIGVWDWDIPTGKVTWTERVHEIHGVPAGGFSGRLEDFSARIHPEDRERVEAAIGAAVRDGAQYHIEFRIVRPDGAVRWLTTSASLLKAPDGSPSRLIGATTDITDRRDVEEALRKSESLYRVLAENIPELVWMSDPQGRSLFFNRQWSDFTGKAIRAGEEGVNRDVIHPDDLPGILQIRERAIEAGRPYRLEFRVRRYDGVWRWHLSRVVPVLGEDGKLAYWFGAATDFHDLRLAEENLRKSEEEFRAMFELAGSGKVQADPATGRFLRVNRRFCQVAGYAEGELLGMAWLDIVAPEDRATAESLLAAASGNGKGDGYAEFRFVRKDGALRWVQVTSTALKGSGERAQRMLATVHDVTERKLAEQEALAAQEKFRQAQKMESIGRLAGGIAHDFNNLLTAINGYADLLLGAMEPDHPHAAYLGEIRQAGERAAGLTRQLLAYSRRQILSPKVADLNGIVSRMSNMLRRLIGEEIRMTTVLGEGLGHVKVDTGQMEQVILNLVVNARDAMPDGGDLHVRTYPLELDQPEEAHDAMVPSGRYVALEIADTGHGMDEDVLARLFEPFFTTKGVGAGPSGRTGTGLGLSMVQGIVRQSDGYIRVWSAPDEGTRFTILLPRVEPVRADGKESGALPLSAPSVASGETVLLVEDEGTVRKYAREILERSGFRVLEAESGEEALRLAELHSEPIHLLVSDVVMPGLTGPKVAEAVLAIRPGLKVLFMSGYSDSSILKHGILETASNFLQKPFSPDDLLRKARAAIAPADS
jgi:PAS domain S-box-containing protein